MSLNVFWKKSNGEDVFKYIEKIIPNDRYETSTDILDRMFIQNVMSPLELLKVVLLEETLRKLDLIM